MVPERGIASVLIDIEMTMVPGPVPLAPELIVIHDSLSVAVQAHPAPAVTVIDRVPPPTPTTTGLGASEYVHVGAAAAACVTVNVCPAIVIVPLRSAPVLRATVKVTVPLLVPLAPPVTLIHVALLIAVQPQPAGAVTVT